MDTAVLEKQTTEFGQRVNAILRTTWLSWQCAQGCAHTHKHTHTHPDVPCGTVEQAP